MQDRRRRPTPLFSRYSFVGGRRRTLRRYSDPPAYYVDRLGAPITAALLTVFLLHVLDAAFTLGHVAQGGTELNPVMNYLIQRSDVLFVAVKLGLAGVGLVFLGAHKNFPLVRPAIAALLAIFAGVVGYHVVLIFS